jgi:thioredoxin-related protein
MMRSRIFYFVGMSMIACSLLFSQINAQTSGFPFFQGTLAQLEGQASQSNTPYFLYFWVLDCADCEKMNEESFTFKPLRTFATQNFLAYKVDGLDFNQGIDVVTRYRVKQYPTVIVMGPDGEIRDRVSGYLDGPTLLNVLQRATRSTDRTMALARKALPEPTSTQRTSSFGTDRAGQQDIANQNPFSSASNPDFYRDPSLVSTGEGLTSRGQDAPDNYGVDKRSYVQDYLDSRQPERAGTSRGGEESRALSEQQKAALQSSFYDDRTRPIYSGATEQGTYAWDERDSKQKEPLSIQERYPNESYLDDRARSQSYRSSRDTYRTEGNTNTYRGDDRATYRSGQDAYAGQNEGSFLDPVSGSSLGTSRGGNDLPQAGQRVSAADLSSLPDGTMLRRGEDGSWYVQNSQAGAFRGDPEQEMPVGSNARMNYRTAEAAAPAPKNISVVRSVPGMDQYSPKNLRAQTFGLLIGTYANLHDLKAAMTEFQENNTARLWVYSEKVEERHFFKLVMGEYNGEQTAVSEALRMGASWDEIEVINLNRLR